MGCGSSSSTTGTDSANQYDRNDRNHHITAFDQNKMFKAPETIIQAYQRMDEEICSLESECPGPRLSTTESWIEHLESIDIDTRSDLTNLSVLPERNSFDLNELEIDNGLTNNNSDSDKNNEHDDVTKVRRLVIQLEVAFDVNKASQQEEFLAKVSQNVMAVMSTQIRAEMIEHARKRGFVLMESYNKLKYLYVEQDTLLSSISGGSYLSTIEEKLDAELETARQIRDKLGSVAEQWRTSGAFLRASAKGALQAVEFWTLVAPSRDASERVSLALDCRTSIQSSLAALEGSQSALPQVDIPYVSPRHASAVRHANFYLLTDMANDARYQHTKDVFESYQNNTSRAVEWMHDTYKKTLKKDLDDAEDVILTIAKKLRQERVKNLSEAVGNRIYVSPEITG